MSEKVKYTTDFEVECLGIQEEWVYDLEIDEYHNFFVNDVLVHNSAMISMEDFIGLLNIPDTTPKEKIVNILDQFCDKKFGPFIDESMKEFAEYSNAYEHRVFFKREKIADAGLYVTKKRYILSVYNSEGVTYKEPKMKIMGIDLVKSSLPKLCRDVSKKMIPYVLEGNKEELLKRIMSFEDEFKNAPVEDIAFPRGVSGLKKYATPEGMPGKGSPIHVRASLLYNKQIDKLKLNKRYETIIEGDKIKFVLLRTPNPIQQDVFAFKGQFPTETGLQKFIDRDLMFKKTFLDPFSSLTDVLEWSIDQNKATLWD